MGYLTFAQVEEVRLRRIRKLIIIENKVRSFFAFFLYSRKKCVEFFLKLLLSSPIFFNDSCVLYWLPCGKEWCSVPGYNKISVNR